ncbi:MAG: hypothetical protein KF734_11835 [Saprospiraceae bacterium]|nr:hypothetical protein [Saprospiraceae bacterium]
MKKSIFAPPRTTLALTVAALLLLNIVVSCHREQAERQMPAPPSDVQVTERATCTTSGYCNLEVTALEDANLALCGDLGEIPGPLDNCNSGCNPNFDKLLEGFFPENVTRERCLSENGSVCIINNEPDTVTVRVKIGSGTTLQFSIPPGQKRCFHTSNCTDTNEDCF